MTTMLAEQPVAGGRSTAASLLSQLQHVRAWTVELAAPLSAEDCALQSMPDASPTKWHLAHTTWFFETFVLKRFAPAYREYHERFSYLFNSYYNALGARHPRPQRGLLSRPSLAEIMDYRNYVDAALVALMDQGCPSDAFPVLEIGMHHEQQHQELLLTDIKHLFSMNPLRPAYESPTSVGGEGVAAGAQSSRWVEFAGGVVPVGTSQASFHYDNEGPEHATLLQPFLLARDPVTNREFEAFVDDGGYQRPEFWLSDGWDCVQRECWSAPLYWTPGDLGWEEFTLAGTRPLDLDAPVAHVSYFEADSFARWAGARLPSEAEWETVARSLGPDESQGAFAEDRCWRPVAPLVSDTANIRLLFGNCWEWTASPYVAYPGYQAPDGALGEYNGKFMCNQFVLRGGSCATPRSHFRITYRNFFQPEKRWQFSGLRLARNVTS